MRTVYIAGPMRGIPLFNFPAFDEAASRLRSAGWNVLSPAEMDRGIGFDENRDGLEAFDLHAAIERDLGAILSLAAPDDAVAMLPGWEKSTGASVERALALWCGLTILDARTLAPFPNETILEEAQRLVYGPRQASYGHPFDDFSRTGRIWGAILGIPDVSPEKVALCMAGLKVSRLVETPAHHDSNVDLAGYAGTYALVRERRATA
jgi:uncharacterized protein DUF6378/uncharacterized protein DUF4406